MNFYRVLDTCRSAKDGVGERLVCYRATIGDAHAQAKRFTTPGRFDAMRIELIDLNFGKDELLDLLNSAHEYPARAPALRTWALTPRSGLKEIANGD